MGCCCYPSGDGTTGQTICFTVSSSSECNFTGLYSEGPCGGCNPVGGFGSRLAEATRDDPLLGQAVQPSYVVLFDFRDVILRRSALGRAALTLFAEHEGRMFDLLRQDRSLETRWLTLLAKGAVFAQDILRAYSLRGQVSAGTLRLDRPAFEEIRDFLREIDARSPEGGFGDLLDRADAIFTSLADRTAAEILALLEVEEGEVAR
ncbi:hypothetical protein [Micromonospora sp. NBS 11-29]|uniref:hypothetical protein n=1 Tax=Micromonospora sp. NBS 11-29 TaxID=1960879 RepID=UPI000B797348|nr:hypothetical protein [Micromonospora sp. NBS 11-29]